MHCSRGLSHTCHVTDHALITDDLMDEIIDRFGDPPPQVNSLLQVALLRADAGKAGITEIAQKKGELRFLMSDFDFRVVNELYQKPEFKKRLRVDTGPVPGVLLKISQQNRILSEARSFIAAWAETAKHYAPEEAETDKGD